MGTRAIVGHLTGSDQFAARYVHWDGYPMSLGRHLATLIARDGASPTVQSILSAPSGWSSIIPDLPDCEGVAPDENAERNSPGYYAHLVASGEYNPEQYEMRPGLGIAYTATEQYMVRGVISTPTGMISDTGRWIEWVYLVDLTGEVLHVADGTDHRIVASLPLDALAQADWTGIECGSGWEQCSHYAWAHDSNVPRSSSLSMRKWVGVDPMTQGDAEAVLCDGERYALTGTSMSPGWHRSHPDGIPVLGRAGKSSKLHLGRTEGGAERWFYLSDTSRRTDLARYSLVMPEVAAAQ